MLRPISLGFTIHDAFEYTFFIVASPVYRIPHPWGFRESALLTTPGCVCVLYFFCWSTSDPIPKPRHSWHDPYGVGFGREYLHQEVTRGDVLLLTSVPQGFRPVLHINPFYDCYVVVQSNRTVRNDLYSGVWILGLCSMRWYFEAILPTALQLAKKSLLGIFACIQGEADRRVIYLQFERLFEPRETRWFSEWPRSWLSDFPSIFFWGGGCRDIPFAGPLDSIDTHGIGVCTWTRREAFFSVLQFLSFFFSWMESLGGYRKVFTWKHVVWFVRWIPSDVTMSASGRCFGLIGFKNREIDSLVSAGNEERTDVCLGYRNGRVDCAPWHGAPCRATNGSWATLNGVNEPYSGWKYMKSRSDRLCCKWCSKCQWDEPSEDSFFIVSSTVCLVAQYLKLKQWMLGPISLGFTMHS